MRVVFWGTPEYSLRSLEALINSEHEIVAVISQPDKKRSRGNKLIPSPIKEYALKQNIPVFMPQKIKGNIEFIKTIKSLSSDLFIVIAYGKILPKEILEIPKLHAWNAHASLLPRWRGAAPIHWALLTGDKYTGVGIMKMEEGLDTGDVLIERNLKIDKEENLISLTKKLSYLSADLFIEAIAKIEKSSNEKISLLLKKQSTFDRKISYARMINKSDYKINWNSDAVNIYRKINAFYPRASCSFRGKNLKIIKIRILEKNQLNVYQIEKINRRLKPGIIICLIKNEGILISTKTDPILLLEAKLEGKNISKNNQLLQQLKPSSGDKLSD